MLFVQCNGGFNPAVNGPLSFPLSTFHFPDSNQPTGQSVSQLVIQLVSQSSSLSVSRTVNNNKNNNNSEPYFHDYNNTALQKRRKHDNLVIRVQFQPWYIYHTVGWSVSRLVDRSVRLTLSSYLTAWLSHQINEQITLKTINTAGIIVKIQAWSSYFEWSMSGAYE